MVSTPAVDPEASANQYDFAGDVTGFDPRDLGDRTALGYRDGGRVCIAVQRRAPSLNSARCIQGFP